MVINFAWPSSPQYTGGVVVLYEFANALSRRGHQVNFLHGPASPYRIDHIDELDWFEFAPQIAHLIVASLDDPGLPSADVVFSPFAPSRLGLPAVIVQGHGMMAGTLERDTFRFRGLKVCVASWLIDVGRQYGSPSCQLVHVPIGIDQQLFRVVTPLGDRSIDVAVLYNEHLAKGWEVGRAALEQVRRHRPGLQVEVFGILPPAFDLPDWLPFRRGLDRRQLVTDVYNQSKVFLQPSWYEGFGLTAVEAMASGCALVTTDNGGSRDYAVDGQTAIVAPPGDVDGLAAGIEALLSDDAVRVRQAEAGMARVRRFTWEHAGELLEGHLNDYLADPSRYQGEPGPDSEPAPPSVGSVPSASGPKARSTTGAARQPPSEPDLVFNIVWTGVVFSALQFFTASLLAHSSSRFRFVVNGCHPDEVGLMEAFQAAHPDRVVEVLVVSPHEMIAHGVALDRVRAQRDDGAYFCLIDPDIKANAPFVSGFAALAADHAAVTSGREVWAEDNFVPDGNIGVAGEHFFDRSGFVFGSPHLAIYDRSALDETCQRWGVGIGSAGPELRQDAKDRLVEMGLPYLVYDTGKIVNALLQGDGHRLIHRDVDQLVHIGGLAHYISPPAYRTNDEGDQEPDWTIYAEMADRHAVSRYTAMLLQRLADGDQAPPFPARIDASLATRLDLVHREITDLVERYGSAVVTAPGFEGPSKPIPDPVLVQAEALLAEGNGRDAVDLLVAATRIEPDPAIEAALVAIRHRAAASNHRSGGGPGASPGDDPFDEETIPEVHRRLLTPQLLATALARHGSLLVRSLLAPTVAEELLGYARRALSEASQTVNGSPGEPISPWYVPFEPESSYSFGAMERTFARSVGSVLSVESPRTLAAVIQAFYDAGVGQLLEGYFGEWPVLSAKKSTLRQAGPESPSEWHQDGAFLGPETRSVNIWVSLTACGEHAPGVEVVPHAFDHIVETGTDDARFSWSVGPALADRLGVGAPLRPRFKPGDALLFDQMTLHRTDVQATMTDERIAIESWFFAPSTYPDAQVPILF